MAENEFFPRRQINFTKWFVFPHKKLTFVFRRLIQLENEKAAKRKAEVTGLFSAFEE